MEAEKIQDGSLEINVKMFIEIAEEAVKHSEGKLRIAHNEYDDSKKQQMEAAHFLKFNEKRLGRDLELYGLMSSVAGNETALVQFLEEIIVPLKAYGLMGSHKNAGEKLKEIGLNVFKESIHEEWKGLFN